MRKTVLCMLLLGATLGAQAAGLDKLTAVPTTDSKAPVVLGTRLPCPANTVYGQPVHEPTANWSAFTSEVQPGYKVYEDFPVTAGQYCGIQFWGLKAYNPGTGWSQCTEDPVTFTIEFWGPGALPGALVATYTVTISGVNTGQAFAGFPLYEYSAVLSPCVNAATVGWVSIQGTGDNCWFLWMSGTGGNTNCLQESSSGYSPQAYDLGLCLTGIYTPTYGACCNDFTGECADNVELQDCRGAGLRFTPDALCADLSPACGLLPGACCYANGTCQVLTRIDCVRTPGDMNCDGIVDFDDIDPFVEALGYPGGAGWPYACPWINGDCNGDGQVNFDDIDPFVGLIGTTYVERLWLGPNTTCEQCPCIVICPSGSTPEAEPCGTDTNGGCNSNPPVFEPIACGETKCGTGWFDGGTRDTDWFELVLTQDSIITIKAKAEFPALVGLLEQVVPGVPGCGNITGYLEPYALVDECELADLTTDCLPAGTYYVFIAPQFLDNVNCPADYVLTVTCEPCGPLPRGACCLSGECLGTFTEQQCAAFAGSWFAGESCDTYVCPPPQPGEVCATAIEIPGVPYNAQGSTCGLINNYSNTCLGSYDGGEDIIYTLTLTEPKCLRITATGLSSADNWLGVAISDVCPPGDPCIARATSSSGTVARINRVDLPAGTYYIMVDTWPAPTCAYFTLDIIECPPPGPGDTCANPIAVTQLPYTATGNTCDYTHDYVGSGCVPTATAPDVVYAYTPTANGSINVSLCGSSYDTVLYVRAGDCLAGTEIGCNDDACGLQSELLGLPVTAGVTYYIFVDGYSAACGDYSLSITAGGQQLQGDTCEDPFYVTGVPFAVTGTTTTFTHNYNEVCPFTGGTARDVVYAYTPANNEVVNISLCNTATNYDSKLYVYQSTCPGTVVGCNDDICSTPSYSSPYVSRLDGVALTGGVTYYIIIDGYGSASGTYDLTITY